MTISRYKGNCTRVEQKTVRNQKTYSLPIQIDEWLTAIFEENKQELALLGITTKTKLLEVLAKNGEEFLRDFLADVKVKRASHKGPQK